ncbi:MAG: helix-turn-helix domain-containing protein [Streptosporangiaceae bacterium]|jgi:DNA-binding transcriptional ArsR family regulator
MRYVMKLDVADLAATRFTTSPLGETVKAVQLLGGSRPPSVNQPWLRWARRELERRPLRLPRLWPLVLTGLPYYPEFLVPAPPGRRPSFADNVAQLRATPATAVRASLGRVFAAGPWPASALDLAERPAESLAEIAAEVTECYQRLVLPHWDRIASVLDADIAYRSGLLADRGARALFGDISPDLRWTGDTLVLSEPADPELVISVSLAPDGLVLMPSVFNWPDVSARRSTSTQTTLVYPARGAATVWQAMPAAAAGSAVAELLGTVRARLLDMLRSPATTTALARQLGVTPSAVSQHLAALHRGGLVDRQRSGRSVLYTTTDLGLALLGG